MRVTTIQLHPITNGPDVVLMVPISSRVDITPKGIGVEGNPLIVTAEGDLWRLAGALSLPTTLFDRATIGEDEAPDQ